jgi:hypothetical protein
VAAERSGLLPHDLADDLHQWLEQGTAARDVLPQVSKELWEIAKALDTGAPI